MRNMRLLAFAGELNLAESQAAKQQIRDDEANRIRSDSKGISDMIWQEVLLETPLGSDWCSIYSDS